MTTTTTSIATAAPDVSVTSHPGLIADIVWPEAVLRTQRAD